jgi:hypothetical protein
MLNKYSSSFAEKNIKIARNGNLIYAKTGLDKDGNPVRGGTTLSKAAADAAIKDAKLQRRQELRTKYFNKENMGKTATGLGSAGMMASMAMSMSDDENMRNMSGGVMMASAALSILPMLANPLGLLIAGIGSLVAVTLILNEQFKQTAKKAYELEMATGGSSKAINNLAKFSGEVTAGEEMDKRRAKGVDVFQGFWVVDGVGWVFCGKDSWAHGVSFCGSLGVFRFEFGFDSICKIHPKRIFS